MDAVVKVYCVHTEPNYSLPWQRKRQFATTSTGFLIDAGGEGHRWLLTNAHSVEYHSQVRPAGATDAEYQPSLIRIMEHRLGASGNHKAASAGGQRLEGQRLKSI